MKRLSLMETIPTDQLFKILNRNNIKRGRVVDHHKPLLLPLEPIKGFYMPEFDIRKKSFAEDYYEDHLIMNKGYRNLAYLLNGAIINANQDMINIGGTTRTISPAKYTTLSVSGADIAMSYPFAFNFGSSTNPHDITRYELYSRYFSLPRGGIWWIEELDTETRYQTYYFYAFPSPSRVMGEAGLYMNFAHQNLENEFLMARVIVDPPVNKEYLTEYNEGWRITFPSNYTRWFLRAYNDDWCKGPSDWGRLNRKTDGTYFVMRERGKLAGSADVMIGRNNTSPSPTDYALKDPITSLSSQSQTVEIDTTLQECRIVRIGTYTPSVNETLGEVGLFTYIYDNAGVGQKVMVARGIWDPTVTLLATTTYTIGIVLRLG